MPDLYRKTGSAVIGILLLFLCSSIVHAEQVSSDRVSFNRDIRPILSDFCFHCHGPDQAKRQGDLRLDLESGAFPEHIKSPATIVRGHASQSELIRRIESADATVQMPPPEMERQLTAAQIALLKQWINEGAKWDGHWSLVMPVREKLPEVKAADGIRSPIDLFVRSRLDQEGLAPARQAEKPMLLRRITLDLTGLPPSLPEIEDFLQDDSADAFERVVDRLLASPRYGERMAIRWINAARYADTSGYQSDGDRTMWRWRDWVIDAYNQNMPFDQFTIEQLAGDLLPNPTMEQRMATGFNRNHRGNAEGGIIPEEFAVEYVVDRVETTSTVWLGQTMMCARCHNHKFDPITQAEFYQLYAFFNNVPEKGRAIKIGNSAPFLVTPTSDQLIKWNQLKTTVSRAESDWQSLQAEIQSGQKSWEKMPFDDVAASDLVQRGLILHLPLDGDLTARVIGPTAAAKPSTYLGQLRSKPGMGNPPAVLNSEMAQLKFTSSDSGKALEVSGSNDAVIGDVANFGFFDKFSISAWVRPTSELRGTVISRMSDVEHGDGWCVVLDQGKLQVHLSKRWLDDACRAETVAALKPDVWQHIVVSYDGTREVSSIRVFINGIPQPMSGLLDELNQSFDNKGVLRVGGGNGPDGRFRGAIDEVRLFDRLVSDDEALILSLNQRLRSIVKTEQKDRTRAENEAVKYAYVERGSSQLARTIQQQLIAAKDELVRFEEQLPTTMVMEELANPREAFVLIRGEYDKRGDRVSPEVPASLPPMKKSSARNRLGLAQWLVSPDHPLTSRVTVNRIWQMMFGTGLVKTVDDFGLQGEWPSHPELLDWLALEFQTGSPTATGLHPANAWDTKRLLRMMTSTATYQQTSQSTAELQQRDPENRLLARASRFRLSAEMIRDQALATSGLLVEQLGGPSVKPRQPEGLWKDLAGFEYEPGTGADLYRRGVYTYWKRTIAPPSMVTFDAPGRETCFVKETRTNTPLQALNLLNDVNFVEAAAKLAEQILVKPFGESSERIVATFQNVTGRVPTTDELNVLLITFAENQSHFRRDLSAAKALTNDFRMANNSDQVSVELAALTTVTMAILNLDESNSRE